MASSDYTSSKRTTTIGWTTHTWNPVTGCDKVSPGCKNCYALTQAERLRGAPGWPVGFDLQLRPQALAKPLKWKRPARIFVNSMSDLFHEDIPDEYLRQVWGVMVGANWHVYQILTKRPYIMYDRIFRLALPLPPHIWLGVSVENQTYAERRIPLLLDIPCEGVRFLSCEPLLGSLDLSGYLSGLDWIITGGESGGQGRRPADYDWFREIRDQCMQAGIPFFHKQGNARRPDQDRELDGRVWDQFPEQPATQAPDLWQPPRQGTLL